MVAVHNGVAQQQRNRSRCWLRERVETAAFRRKKTRREIRQKVSKPVKYQPNPYFGFAKIGFFPEFEESLPQK
jgi:hypothetical protein